MALPAVPHPLTLTSITSSFEAETFFTGHMPFLSHK